MSMLYESTAIVSVNGYLYLYQFIFVGKYPLDKLLKSFSIHTAVSLAIEWVFNSVSLAIETRYQNMAVINGCLAKTMEASHFSSSRKCSPNVSVE